MKVVDIAQGFSSFSEHWRPRIAATLNGQEVKLAKLEGPFVWHKHDVDEMFLVWRGQLTIEMRDDSFELHEGQILVVPAGMEHRPVAHGEVEVVLFESVGVVNTGDAPVSEFTAPETQL